MLGSRRFTTMPMGNAVFPLIAASFEEALCRYRISFNSAADIGCGTGAFLRYLQGSGVPLWGVDISPAMLDAAGKRITGGAVLLLQDMKTFTLPRKVDLITCNFDTVNYLLNRAQIMQFLSRCYHNLAPGGHLVFDAISGGLEKAGWQMTVQRIRLPGIISRWRILWSARKKMSIVRMVHFFRTAGNFRRKTAESHYQKWHSLPFMKRCLSDAGLVLLGAHDARSMKPAGEATFWVKYIARKKV